jgi:hypothetical protein
MVVVLFHLPYVRDVLHCGLRYLKAEGCHVVPGIGQFDCTTDIFGEFSDLDTTFYLLEDLY